MEDHRWRATHTIACEKMHDTISRITCLDRQRWAWDAGDLPCDRCPHSKEAA
jgi:hypothetical protein